MNLLKKYQKKYGLTHVVGKGESGLKKAMFDLLNLEAENSYIGDTGSNESAFVILSGTCSITGNDFKFEHIGNRKDVFSGKPTTVYLPCHTPFKIVAETGLEIGICSAGSTKKSSPVLIGPDDVTEVNLGVLNWTRKAYFIVDQKTNAENLFIGETFIPAGNWAFPPHRHDHDNLPSEVDMDEIYHFRINPPSGFGIQVSYTDDRSRDNSYTLRNGDTTILADGYHPVGTSPVDSLYMLWMMAGEKRLFLSRPDDDYTWVIKCENLLKQKK
ncbi:MAG: 5-deoxy-glucuronate isomerase [Prolixibacteraceae bacterium]|jgi:5-deoxy-glucuronate isomerase|nr:5-deoxy-glucuronate isomerase [Prolixibacteraceae bacterium]